MYMYIPGSSTSSFRCGPLVLHVGRIGYLGTVRYGTCCMRHYIMSAAFCYLPTGTYLTSARTGHVFSLPPGRYLPFYDAALPPTGNQIIFHRSPNDIPLSSRT